MQPTAPALSYLFVPGTQRARFDKALASGAHAIILDWEDAVAPADKASARATVVDWLAAHPAPGVPVWVRINDANTAWYHDDLRALQQAWGQHAGAGGAGMGVVLPKCESAAQVSDFLAAFAHPPALIALVESARGVQQLDTIACASGLTRLAFGSLDYALDLDLPEHAAGLAYAAARMAIASKVAGLPAPIAGVTPALDSASVQADLHWARGFGFAAKLCIHPVQVAAVHAALQPHPEQLAWAERVLTATQGQAGAMLVDGRMVDRPIVLQALAIVARAAHTKPAPAKPD